MSELQSVRAVLFDFDGTLVDSDAAQLVSFNQVLAPHGRDMSEATYASVAGWSNDAIFDSVFPTAPAHFLAELSNGKEAALLVNQGLVVLQPGAADTLSRLSQGGLRLALVTSASRGVVEPILRRLEIADYFETCICHEDVESKKPHPAPYQLALTRLGLEAAEVLAVEDSDVGFRSAKAASVEVILYKPRPGGSDSAFAPNQISHLAQLIVRLSHQGQ